MKQYSLNIFLALILFAGGLVLADSNPVSAESKGDMESMMKQSIAVWNSGNTVIAQHLYSPDVVVHMVDQDPPQLNGVKEIMDHVSFIRTAYPDMKYEPIQISVDGDRVIAETVFEGTNAGPRGDLPPTNKKVKVSVIIIAKITDGVITEEWIYTNQAAIFNQLGFTITPPSSDN